MPNHRLRIVFVILTALTLAAFLVGMTMPAQAAPLPGIVYRPNEALTDNLVAYWTLDESNTNRSDSIGGNTLAQTGGNLPATTGIISTAGQFSSGNSYYLKAPDSASLSMGDIDFSVAGWVEATGTPPSDEIILAKSSAGTAATTEYLLYIEGSTGKLTWTVCNGSTCSAVYGPVMSVNTWYFVVAWHDASANTINIEVNNNGTIYTSSYSGGSFNSSAPFMIGRYDHSATYHSELIDEVGIWKKVLSSGERTTLYNGGLGCAYPFAICNPVNVNSTSNYLQDGSFETFPFLNFLGLSPWFNSWATGSPTRVTSSPPEFWSTNSVVVPICGDSFWQLDAIPGQLPAVGQFDHTGTYTEQEFDWPGGDMYISMGARTSDANTSGLLQLVNPDSSITVLAPDFAPNTANWQMFHYQKASATAGTYKIQVKARTVSNNAPGHVAIDAMSVHEGYWINDCGLPTALWNKNEAQVQNLVTVTPTATGPTATLNVAGLTATAGTRIAIATSTQAANATATQRAVTTNTAAANATSTKVAANNATATKGAQNTQTAIAGLSGLTATQAAANATATRIYVQTSTAFVSSFRQTQTAQANATQTQAYINQQYVQSIFASQTAVAANNQIKATQTEIARETQVGVPPIIAQLTLQAQIIQTNAAILTQQANGQNTQQAQATATNNATAAAQLTQAAQKIATLQALSTLQATQVIQVVVTAVGQGQTDTTMPPLTEWQWDVGCTRPTNAINIPAWIDYSVCRMMSWLSWQDTNTVQLQYLWQLAYEREPFATIQAFINMMGQIIALLGNVNWDSAQSCSGNMFALIQPAGELLSGNINLTTPPTITNTCSLPYGPVIGDEMESGVCWTYNFLCAYGILQLLRWSVNVIIIIAFFTYVQLVWVARAQA